MWVGEAGRGERGNAGGCVGGQEMPGLTQERSCGENQDESPRNCHPGDQGCDLQHGRP